MAKRLAIGTAVVALGVVVVLVQRGVRPEFVLFLGVIGALFAALHEDDDDAERDDG